MFDPTFPANNSPATAVGMRDQLNALKALIDAVPAGPPGPTGATGATGPAGAAGISLPIGGVGAWLKSFAGTPALDSQYAECNGQVLNDVASPYHGLTLPNLNGAGGGVPRFLRGALVSGGEGGAESHMHSGTTGLGDTVELFDPPGSPSLQASRPDHTHGFTTDPAASLPSYHEVVWVMRVK